MLLEFTFTYHEPELTYLFIQTPKISLTHSLTMKTQEPGLYCNGTWYTASS